MSISPDRESMPPRQLGELMTELGLISEEQLATVLEVQQKSKRPLGQIIVELGFASGAAVAHALAMQSGGALRTEYGFALGINSEERADDETRAGLPKLRLAPTAIRPEVRPKSPADEELETAKGASLQSADESSVAAAPLDEEEPKQLGDTADPPEVVQRVSWYSSTRPDEAEESAAVERVDVLVEGEENSETEPLVEPDPVGSEPAELEQLRTDVDRLEGALAEAQASAASERERLRAEVERLETALADGREADRELERLQAEVERLEGVLADARTEREQELGGLQEEYDRAKAELERLQAVLAEAQVAAAEQERRLAEEQERHAAEQGELVVQTGQLQEELASALERVSTLGSAAEERDELRGDVERLEGVLADTQTQRDQEVGGLRDERDHANAELQDLRAALGEAQSAAVEQERRLAEEQERRLAEEQERHAAEQGELVVQTGQLQEELASALEQVSTLGPAAEERDQLRAEVDRLEGALAETLSAAVAEQDQLRADVERLERELEQTQAARERELGRLRQELDEATAELERLQAALAEAQSAAAEQERRLAEEQERHAAEERELVAQSGRLQQELGSALERLASLGPAAEERDQLRVEVERLETALAETQESCAEELRRAVEDRDRLSAELAEAQELLLQAERVRESQIALTAERDQAVAELERFRTVAAEAQATADEQSRLLAEEQDRHYGERESLLAQRKLLEEELGDALERLASAAAEADERREQLQVTSGRLHDTLDEAHAAAAAGVERLDAARRVAAELASVGEELADQPQEELAEEPDAVEEPAAEAEIEAPPAKEEIAPPEDEAAPTENEAAAQVDEADALEAESSAVDYALFVPGPNGYELVQQTGIPPEAGETVELVLPDRDEPSVFEVVRSGRSLPGGGICVYLAQV